MSSKDDILKAAMRVFLRHGYEKASMRDIVAESGFAKGGIYHHFKNKEAIFLAAMEGLMVEMDKWFSALFAEKREFKDILHTYFKVLPDMKDFLNGISGSIGEAEYNYYILIFEGLKKIPAFKKQYYEQHEYFLREFASQLEIAKAEGIIKSNIDSETLGFMIHALLDGSYIFSMFSEDIDLPQIAEKMFQTIWNIISTE